MLDNVWMDMKSKERLGNKFWKKCLSILVVSFGALILSTFGELFGSDFWLFQSRFCALGESILLLCLTSLWVAHHNSSTKLFNCYIMGPTKTYAGRPTITTVTWEIHIPKTARIKPNLKIWWPNQVPPTKVVSISTKPQKAKTSRGNFNFKSFLKIRTFQKQPEGYKMYPWLQGSWSQSFRLKNEKFNDSNVPFWKRGYVGSKRGPVMASSFQMNFQLCLSTISNPAKWRDQPKEASGVIPVFLRTPLKNIQRASRDESRSIWIGTLKVPHHNLA